MKKINIKILFTIIIITLGYSCSDDFVNVKSDGVDVVAANKVQAAFGATTKIGVDENDSTFVQIDSDSVDIIEDVSGTNTTVASFGLATVIGPVANSKSRIELGSGIVKIINSDRSHGNSNAFTIQNILSVVHSLLQIVLRSLRYILFYRNKNVR